MKTMYIRKTSTIVASVDHVPYQHGVMCFCNRNERHKVELWFNKCWSRCHEEPSVW